MEPVLLIEKNYMMRLFLINYLDRNFDVTAVESPAEALELLQKKWRPAAILSNFYSSKSLERTDFLSLITFTEINGIPSIVLTDEDKSEQRIETLKIGAKDTLSKPFNPVELQLRLMSAMGLSVKEKMKRVA
ncbi:MAG TPA: response regulator [Roseivirga sp.]